jgi:hypothetical protein
MPAWPLKAAAMPQAQGYDVVGVRYDADSHNNLIILEQTIGEDADE